MYPEKPSTTSNVWQSNTFRLVLIGALTLVLLIPLLLVQNLVRERKERQQEVINEIDSKWGARGLFLWTYSQNPLIRCIVTRTKNVFETQYAYFLPRGIEKYFKCKKLK